MKKFDRIINALESISSETLNTKIELGKDDIFTLSGEIILKYDFRIMVIYSIDLKEFDEAKTKLLNKEIMRLMRINRIEVLTWTEWKASGRRECFMMTGCNGENLYKVWKN